MNEIWKPITRFSGYEASSMGQVRSVNRICRTGPSPGEWLRPGQVLTPSPGPFKKYLVVNIKGKPRFVHVLVAEAFIGLKPKGMDTAHINGVATDNRIENLRYASRSDNNRDITDHGKRKLTREQVRTIRLMTFNHGDKASLERQLGLARGTVKHILNGRIYAER